MNFIKRNLVILLIFVVTAVSVFLIWPAEKDSYAHCNPNDLCNGQFSTVMGGGAFYLAHIKQDKTSFADAPLVQQLYIQNEQSYYLFSPVIVSAVALFIGAGATVIAVITRRVIRRRKHFQDNTNEPLEQ